MPDDVWPLFDLRIVTPRLELRPLTPDDAFPLMARAAEGVHDPATMPFDHPWTDAEPLAMQRNGVQFIWRCWSSWSPEAWQLPFGIHLDGELIGNQELAATEFAVRRTVTTGSWLGLAHQGQGLGTEMRAAALAFAFGGLGARRAETAAWPDNAASLGVTRALGYRPNGTRIGVRRGERAEQLLFALERDDFSAPDDVRIEGLTPACLELLGAD